MTPLLRAISIIIVAAVLSPSNFDFIFVFDDDARDADSSRLHRFFATFDDATLISAGATALVIIRKPISSRCFKVAEDEVGFVGGATGLEEEGGFAGGATGLEEEVGFVGGATGLEEEGGFVGGATGLLEEEVGFAGLSFLGLPVFLCGRSQQNCFRPESIQRRHGRLVSHRNFWRWHCSHATRV